MRPMMRLVLGLLVLVGIMAGVAFGLPAHVTVTRSKSISAPESIVFPYLNNLHKFSEWSPWQLRDPQLKVTYSGPQLGKGAEVKWTSEKPSVGTGSMQILESEPNHSIDLAVDFNGLEGTGSYHVVPDGSGSKVTWNFVYESGSSPLKRWKALMLDGFIGAEYGAGLDRLKEKIEAERRPAAPSVGLTPEGMPLQPGQPGTTTVPEGAVPPGAALPGDQTAPAGTAPAGGEVPKTAPSAATADPNAASPAAVEAAPPPPPPTPSPPPKKKKRRR